MHSYLLFLALFAGQMNPLQDQHVVHLRPHQDNIPVEFGGRLLELMNAPMVIQLPQLPPKPDLHGFPWSIDIKNLGPARVTVAGNALFGVQIRVGQTVHIKSTSRGYSLLPD